MGITQKDVRKNIRAKSWAATIGGVSADGVAESRGPAKRPALQTGLGGGQSSRMLISSRSAPAIDHRGFSQIGLQF